MEIKTILISQYPLPYHKIGSWTTMYNHYLESKHLIDIIICDKPVAYAKNVEYLFVRTTKLLKLKSYLLGYKYLEYLNKIDLLINDGNCYILQIIDNKKLFYEVDRYLKEKNVRNSFHIQFFYHGFAIHKHEKLINNVDELILLTYSSYKKILIESNEFLPEVNILNNGVDTLKFKTITNEEIEDRKRKSGYEGKTLFLWLSNDKPKKGKHILLKAWEEFSIKNKNVHLLIIGSSTIENCENISFLGKIHNSELPYYYQISDVYLFTTLCQEGFGLSLLEALYCGCYCIVSGVGGVNEVVSNGTYAKVVEYPNIISEWVKEMEFFVENRPLYPILTKDIYSLDKWTSNLNKLIHNAINRFSKIDYPK